MFTAHTGWVQMRYAVFSESLYNEYFMKHPGATDWSEKL